MKSSFYLIPILMLSIGGISLSAHVNPVELPPLSEGFPSHGIKVPPGFTVERVAGPPLVEHPTFATFDDRGRLFVCENAGVNMEAKELEEKRPNSIRLLEDLDGDGRFDKSTVFADRMTFPMGGAWHDGALYVASPPSIWRLEDTDGDGVADKRDVIVGAFGFTGNAASIHGCVPGPDGRLYWCDGFHGHKISNEEGEITSQREGSYIFSCRPDGSDVRIHCGGGMDNPVEVDFTVEGEMLGTVNIFYTRPRVDCLVHWLYGGAYPHREKILSEIKVTGDVLGPVHRFGHVTVSGTTRYRSGVMNPQWRDNMFVTFFNSGKVVRVETEREGSTFRATQREFLSCVKRDFHPTDVAEDADGSLLIVDTGGWFYRGCPTSQHAKPDIKGAIYRVRRAGMTTQVDPWGNRIDWSELTNAELVGLFNDTRFKVQERAVAECTLRGESMVPTLSKEIRRNNPRQRLNTLWALTRIVGHSFDPSSPNGEPQSTGSDTHPLSPARAAIRLALDDANPSVRLAACRSLATYPDAMATDRLLDILQTETPPLRREAATALGRLGDRRAVPALLAALARPANIDRTEEHAITYAIIETNDSAATRKGLTATSTNTQRAALIALDQMDDGHLTADDVASLFASNDARLQQTAADVFIRHGDWSARAADVLNRLLDDPNTAERRKVAVGQLAQKFIAEPAVGELIGRFIGDAQTSRAVRDQLLRAISQGQEVPLHPSWIQPLEGLLRSDDPATVELTLSALSTIRADRFRAELQRFGADPTESPFLRATALQIASGMRGALTDSAFELLVELLDGDASNESQAAAQKIGSSALSKPQLLRLAPRLESAGPSQLRDLVRPYQRSKDVEVGTLFLATMEQARGFMNLAPHEFSDVIKRFPRELLPPANRLLERLRQEEQNRLARVDQLLPILLQGNRGRGRALFFDTKTQCATCHRVGNQGGQIGPDLTMIGANRDAHDLLESIVFPSATIVRDHETIVIETVDGNVLSGMIVRETVDTLYIQQLIGDPLPVARRDIQEMRRSTVSMMPSGLDQALDKQELADLVAFLMNLKQPPAL